VETQILLPRLIIHYDNLGESQMVEGILIKKYGYSKLCAEHLSHYYYTIIYDNGNFDQTNSIDKRISMEVFGHKYISSTDFIEKY